MIFKKREDYLVDDSFAAADAVFSQTIRKEITREFPIESIYLKVKFTFTGVANTLVDTWYNLVRRVVLQVADGARTRNVVDASGTALVEYARQIHGGLDSGWITRRDIPGANDTSPATYEFIIPIFFALPQVSDPVSSALLLPAPRYNSNLILTVALDSKANVTTGAGTVTSAVIGYVINRREVNIPDWDYYDTELSEISTTFAGSGSQLFELPVPGAYTGLLMRFYDNSTPKLRINPDSTTSPENRLQYLGNVIRRFRMTDCQAENELSIFLPNKFQQTVTIGVAATAYSTIQKIFGVGVNQTSPTAGVNEVGVYYKDFLADRPGQDVDELGSVLDTNFLMATGARLQLVHNLNAASYTANYLIHRIYGDISDLQKNIVRGPRPSRVPAK
jgi:hypothetical protein